MGCNDGVHRMPDAPTCGPKAVTVRFGSSLGFAVPVSGDGVLWWVGGRRPRFETGQIAKSLYSGFTASSAG
jgi:hypothetical protein